ncbi:hypothetical protein JXA47_03015 [Candidatus Sumerlaeota bacterium]|nr:hypothetical protein [Candidatus Sumerlaeota bacterium]
MRSFRLAMGQMHVEGGDPDRNLRRAGEMIRGAAAQDCDLIVLPECLEKRLRERGYEGP